MSFVVGAYRTRPFQCDTSISSAGVCDTPLHFLITKHINGKIKAILIFGNNVPLLWF
jgi:hypothetical protein